MNINISCHSCNTNINCDCIGYVEPITPCMFRMNTYIDDNNYEQRPQQTIHFCGSKCFKKYTKNNNATEQPYKICKICNESINQSYSDEQNKRLLRAMIEFSYGENQSYFCSEKCYDQFSLQQAMESLSVNQDNTGKNTKKDREKNNTNNMSDTDPDMSDLVSSDEYDSY